MMIPECVRLAKTLPLDTQVRLASFSKNAYSKQGATLAMDTEGIAAWELYWIARDPKREAPWGDPLLVDAVKKAKDFYRQIMVAEKIGG